LPAMGKTAAQASGAVAPHWADIYADRIIREKGPLPKEQGGKKREEYTCASGITPSGTVHIGNFREIISVELVVRALREKGQPVRFIYSWDDYDVFRKVPRNIPNAAEFETYLRWPITLIPDPYGREENYARGNEADLEKLLPVVGVEPDYIYQAGRYRKSAYAAGIRKALENRDVIRRILNQHRTHPLDDSWWPISVFSTFTNKDTTTVLSWDGAWGITYRCEQTGNEETLDLRTTGAVKLLWRIDWPMRWAEEGVDFEPAGKDHHSEGGSFDTARHICNEVYGVAAPVSFQYDFISIKGKGGKISSSTGEVVSLQDVLEIYQPEVVRYLFAGTKPNSEFAISFDLDVLKIYEDYDKCERIYFGAEEVGEKRRAKEARTYELSQVSSVPGELPVQIPLRHLCNFLQINSGDVAAALDAQDGSESWSEEQRRRLERRARCAWNWVTTYAPEDFRFTLKDGSEEPVECSEAGRAAITALREELAARYEQYDEKGLAEAIYRIAGEAGIEPKDFFVLMYQVLIGKTKGPRLAGFIRTVGRDRVLKILESY